MTRDCPLLRFEVEISVGFWAGIFFSPSSFLDGVRCRLAVGVLSSVDVRKSMAGIPEKREDDCVSGCLSGVSIRVTRRYSEPDMTGKSGRLPG